MRKTFLLFFAVVLSLTLLINNTQARSLYYDNGCIATYYDDCYEQPPVESGGGSNILRRYIRVTSPNGGEIWGRKADAYLTSTESAIYDIAWESFSYNIDTVDIYYTTDSGQNYQEIVTNYSNSGQYAWTLPAIDAENVIIKITAYGPNRRLMGSDLSNSSFVIYNNVPVTQDVNADLDAYQYILLGASTINPVHPGDKLLVNATIFNSGQATWYKHGEFPIHLGTTNPQDQISPFAGENWLNNNRPAGLEEEIVYPGEVGTFVFEFDTTGMSSGIYHVQFRPVAEYLTWMNDGSVIEWQIEVI